MSKSLACLIACACFAAGCGDLTEEDRPSGFSPLELQMLDEVNAQRAKGATCGGKQMPPSEPLVLVRALTDASAAHSEDMAQNGYFSHTGQDGSSPTARAQRQGYEGGGVGENIAAGRDTVPAVMQQWMASSGHCKNIMRANYKVFGIGYAQAHQSVYRHYWTQMFGS